MAFLKSRETKTTSFLRRCWLKLVKYIFRCCNNSLLIFFLLFMTHSYFILPRFDSVSSKFFRLKKMNTQHFFSSSYLFPEVFLNQKVCAFTIYMYRIVYLGMPWVYVQQRCHKCQLLKIFPLLVCIWWMDIFVGFPGKTLKKKKNLVFILEQIRVGTQIPAVAIYVRIAIYSRRYLAFDGLSLLLFVPNS